MRLRWVALAAALVTTLQFTPHPLSEVGAVRHAALRRRRRI